MRNFKSLLPLSAGLSSNFDSNQNADWFDEDDNDGKEEQLDQADLEAAMRAMDDITKMKKEQKARERDALKAAGPIVEQKVSSTSGLTGSAEPEKGYVPKVSTWGVFERPKDISKAYGGGRNINAGTSVSREEAEKRREELQALIKQVKQGDGVSPALVAQASNNLTEADRFLEKLNYERAEYILRCVRKALPFRNRLAGRATLELGTILDAQGRYQEAAELYKSLTKHPDGEVRKQATRLSESFEALRFFRYSNASTDQTWSNTIRPLLRGFVTRNSEAVAVYKATPEDLILEKKTQQAAYMVIGALFLVPLSMVACLTTVSY